MVIVQGGKSPGGISKETIVWGGELSRGKLFRSNCPGSKSLGSNSPGGNFMGRKFSGEGGGGRRAVVQGETVWIPIYILQ